MTAQWPDDKVSLLTALWAKGHSVTEIGALLGIDRGAVSGKIDRMGLNTGSAMEVHIAAATMSGPLTRPRNRQAPTMRGQPSGPPSPPRPLPVRAPDPTEPVPRMVSLMEIRDRECHWPHGDPGAFRYCGAPASVAVQYCAFHQRLMWRRS